MPGDKFDEEAAALELHIRERHGYESIPKMLASALRSTHEKADREAEIRTLEWALGLAEGLSAASVAQLLCERLAELRKGKP